MQLEIERGFTILPCNQLRMNFAVVEAEAERTEEHIAVDSLAADSLVVDSPVVEDIPAADTRAEGKRLCRKTLAADNLIS